ncbi:MAG: hypothetical protein ACRDPM_01185 [Solirubrobacteraceae bacterium]
MSDEHDRKDHPLPGSVSDQNAEEAEPGHGGGEHAQRKGGGDTESGGESGGATGGESGEGSQSTGHPDSAG